MRITVQVADPELVGTARAWLAELGTAGEIVALESGGDPAIPVLDFFAGDLAGPDGECVALVANREASGVAFGVADRVLAGSPRLRDLNFGMGRGTLRLFLAKQSFQPIRKMLVRIGVAEALFPGGMVVLRAPSPLPVEGLVPGIDAARLRFPPDRPALRTWLGPLRSVLASQRRRMGRREPVSWDLSSSAACRVLVPHEDALGLDPALRRQPHWFVDEPNARFEVLVYPVNQDLKDESTDQGLATAGIRALSLAHVRALSRWAGGAPWATRFANWRARALRAALLDASPATRWAAGLCFRLVVEAESVTATVVNAKVDVMLTSDPHLIQADAMAVAAQITNCPLVCYQYSNLAMPSVAMMTTADRFLVFHDAFVPVWNQFDSGAGHHQPAGYPFDDVFAAVAGRARDVRAQLEASGARYVVCLFDESVQEDKFGIISLSAHRSELRALLSYLLESPEVGVVVKSQFQTNTPSRRYPDDEVIRAAMETGRFLELTAGDHRNLVYPAEAALISDIAIGSIVGATASLEAALAGRRSLLLDQHGQKRHRRDLYDQADLVYGSMDEAIDAIRRHREGDPTASDLGDWTPIIDQFDAFRDGRSSVRLRETLAELGGRSEQ